MGPKVFLLLCLTVALSPANCELKSSRDDERARLPEFLTELDLASLEASQEDIEAIKTVVKRLAPEKNVFFGNEELLKEWLKGAGVMGQPGVDFPALTTIPATTFSCRGLKGGYYADLETNCQVFHICDNGRKISFLCPNGTIFQQSQLICDWWFKVDCSKSAELYEQSAEQLAEDERKRAEAKRINSEFHRSNEANEDENGQSYYQSQNSNYDGRQNGRMNPFGQVTNKNQIPGSSGQRSTSTDSQTSTRAYDPNQIYSLNAVTPSQYNQINELAVGNAVKNGQDFDASQTANSYKNRHQQQATQSTGRSDGGNYRGIDRQRNQLVEVANEETKRQFNYESRGASKYPGSNQQSYNNQQHPGRSNQPNAGHSSSNSARDGERRNYHKSGSIDREQSSNRPTPSYTETTTFRTSTSNPIREYQQFAESAAFASNRGHRFNEAYSSSQFNTYYNSNYNNRDSSSDNGDDKGEDKARPQQKATEKPRPKSITPTPGSEKTGGNVLRVRVGQPSGFPTSQPIYKPRENDRSPGYESTTSGTTPVDVVATTEPYTDDSTQSNQAQTSYRDNFDYGTTTSHPSTHDWQVTTETSTADSYMDDYARNSVTPSDERTIGDFFENTTPTIISSGTYVNAKAYTSSGLQAISHHRITPSASGFTTSKPQSKSQDYELNSVVTASSSPASIPGEHREVSRDRSGAKSNDSRNQHGRGTSRSNQRMSSSYKPLLNSIGTSTEKPFKSLALGIAQTGFTGKTLSPYDTSITYQQGKVMSTLGPYVPFTKNYAYSTPATSTTTTKPPVYTATVPAYSTTAANYRISSAKSTGVKLRVSSTSGTTKPTGRFSSGSGAYLPEKKSEASTHLAKKHGLEERPLKEREHAMGMLQSLRGLEEGRGMIGNGSRSGLNVPTSSGPSTLHSLALYFATAGDDFDVTAETRQGSGTESTEKRGPGISRPSEENTGIELPKSILTQHTINSYADLFNLNNALEGNSSSKSDPEVGQDVSNEETDDLDIQQSQGPVDGIRKSNGTRLRELAQVFTHALSAYLQDPDTFKKILTEIRPTEPSGTSEEGYTATTLVPTTLEDYPSVTKEKDEVLDFSDDTAPHRGRRPTTVYPAAATDLPITTERYDQHDHYTTTSNYYTTLGQDSDDESDRENNFAFQVNSAFGTVTSDGNDLTSGGGYYPLEVSGPSGTTALDRPEKDDPLKDDYADNYFPSDASNNKIGGFANNTATTIYEPYGKHVKPFDVTPISDNYVASSTPATYVATVKPEVSRKDTDSSRRRFDAKKSGNSIGSADRKHDERGRSTTQPFRIRYYDESTPLPPDRYQESLITAGSVYSKYRGIGNDLAIVAGDRDKANDAKSVATAQTIEPFDLTQDDGPTTTVRYETDGDRRSNDHWTSSPVVTQLWESTVFVDPERINEGLVSGAPQDSPYSTVDYTEATAAAFTSYGNSSDETKREVSAASVTRSNNPSYTSSTWGWSSDAPDRNDDSPTAFTLLPKPITEGKTVATPTPIYTTRSSITTTITSSVTSTSSSTPGLPAPQTTASPIHHKSTSSRPKHAVEDNEVIRAHEMFGKLNDTSSDTLMRVMKQADTNATVRQLVLLLINHCNGPMNKTMEEEKEQLLGALLRMPVDQFTSEESRDLVAGINNLNLPIGNHPSTETTSLPATTTTIAPTTTTEEPVITTFRSKKGRRLKIKLDENSPIKGPARKKQDIATAESSADSNALSSEDTSASDARALELLRSLYTIAAKWG